MSVAHDAVSESHTGTVGVANVASFTWNHVGGASARSALVFTHTYNGASPITGVTYGGVSMTKVPYDARDTDTEPGHVEAWFLDNCGTGTKAVVVNRTDNALATYATCMTQTAASACEVYLPGVWTRAGNAAAVRAASSSATGISSSFSSMTLDDGSPGTNSIRYMAVHSGGSSVSAASTNTTTNGTSASIDFGLYVFSTYRQTTPSQGAVALTIATAISDDLAVIGLAIREALVNPVDHDAGSESGSPVQNVASMSWTHTPVGTPKGVLVHVATEGGAGVATGATYGGVAMTEVTGNGYSISTGASVQTFFLGRGIPTGAQTVVVSRYNNDDFTYAVCATVTGPSDTEVYAPLASNTSSNTVVQVAVDDGSPTYASRRYVFIARWVTTALVAGPNSQIVQDFYSHNSRSAGLAVELSSGKGSRLVGFNDASTSSWAQVQLVIRAAVSVTGTSAATFKFSEAATGTGGAATITGTSASSFKSQPQAWGALATDGTYEQAVIQDRPISYWPLNDTLTPSGSGDAIKDYIGNRHPATFSNVYSTTPYPTDHAGAMRAGGDSILLGDGANFQFVTIPNAAALNLGDGPFSIEFWFSKSTYTGSAREMKIWNTGITNGNPQILLRNNDDLDFDAYGLGNVIDGPNFTGDNQIHHVVVTHTSTTSQMYVDGVSVGTATDRTFVSPTDPIHIGASDGDGWDTFVGQLADFAIYDYVLSAARVREHYRCGSRYATEVYLNGPIAYWRLGERAGSTVARDEMATYDGTYVNTPDIGAAGLLWDGEDAEPDNAVALDGTDGVTFTGPVIAGGDWSLAAWIKPTTVASGWHGVFGASTGGVGFGLNGTGLYVTSVDLADAPAATGFTAAINTKYFVVATYEQASGYLSYYVNGVRVSYHTFSPTWLGVGQRAIGARSWPGTDGFVGTIDEPTIFDYALAPNQINTLYILGANTMWGTSAASFKFSEAATGTHVNAATGTAASSFKFSHAATGAEAISGTSATTFKASTAATGAETMSGTSAATWKFSHAATGAEAFAGTSAATFKFSHAATGAETLSGTSAATFKFSDAARGWTASGYAAVVMADNPVGYWRLGEPSGTTAVDEMGNGNGTYVNSPTLGVAGGLSGDDNTAVTFGAT